MGLKLLENISSWTFVRSRFILDVYYVSEICNPGRLLRPRRLFGTLEYIPRVTVTVTSYVHSIESNCIRNRLLFKSNLPMSSLIPINVLKCRKILKKCW